jgi:pyruvate dehydrogenase E2 component (dihydrolipoamide acetyltransferase)
VLAHVGSLSGARLAAASPKARRLALERGLDVTTVRGSGPSGAVLVADLPAATPSPFPGEGSG